MLFSDPLSSSLFLQPLSPLPNNSHFLNTSTTSATTMTSSSCAAARRGIVAESDPSFPFLESKPSLMDAEHGRRGHGKAAKGRRHAGEAMLRRKLANQAFLVKVGGGAVGAAAKELSKGARRRERVLSELVADEFAPSVPYSLNRKSRWAHLSASASGGAEWLAAVAARDCSTGAQPASGHLRISLAEADYTLDGSESVRAFHSVDTASGMLESRWAKSSRGAASVGDLMGPPAAEQENEEPLEAMAATDELHFQLQRPHSVGRLFAAKFFKKTKAIRSAKRSAVETFSGPTASTGQTVPRATKGVLESEPEEESEFAAQYRPCQKTYSLADFVKESSTPPVMVRRPAKGAEEQSSEEDEEQFAIVPLMECVPLSSRSASVESAGDSAVSGPSKSSSATLRDSLRHQLSQRTASPQGILLRVPFRVDTDALSSLASRKGDWRPNWAEDGVLMLDLSWELLGGGKEREPEEPLAVVVLDGQELTLNTVFPSSDQPKLEQLAGSAHLGVDQKVEALFQLLRQDCTDWTTKRKLGRVQHLSTRLELYRSVFHSTQLALSGQPLSVRAVLVQQREENAREEGQFEGTEELLGEGRELEHRQPKEDGDEHNGDGEEWEEEEFELVDIDELLEEGGDNSVPAAVPPLMDLSLQCADCARCPAPRLTMLRSCGHRCCGACLEKSLLEAQRQFPPLCPVCPVPVPLDLLPRFLPLAEANTLCLTHFVHQSPPQRLLAKCPGCEGILDFGQEDSQKLGSARHLCCARCSILWCADCGSSPHWPLSCAQNDQWTLKFAQHERCHEVPEAMKSGVIAGQFAEICSEARARRIDVKLGWQLGKHMRRLQGDSKAERRFVGTRKTALHLLEFGTAWLYLHRQSPRPPVWARLKSLLWALRDRVECLDNELLFSGSLSDTQGLQGRVEELEQLVEKARQHFTK